MNFKFEREILWQINESYISQSFSFEHGNSSQSAQVSNSCFLTQQVIIEQEGCLLKKSGPQHPGHLEGPIV